jgi:VIT1/CCC1 family predicted Fe2+/Mn2+ transporter
MSQPSTAARRPVSLVLHGIIEYVAGVAFIAAPFVLGFDGHRTPERLSIIVGALILCIATASEGFPTSLLDVVPPAMHVILDWVLGVFLIAAPWLFGFSGVDAAKWWFVALGVAHLLVTWFTARYPMGDHVVGSLAEGTSTHIERGDHTSADR